MKNKLLITTALVSAAFAFSANASAQEANREVVNGSKQVIDGDYHDMTTTTGKPGGVFSVGTGGANKEKRGHLTLTRGKFYKNFAQTDGGAIGNYGDLSVNGTVFEDNVADWYSNNITASDNNPIGGGALALGIESKTDITGATFTHNIAGFNGGAIGTRRTLNKNQELPDHYLHIKSSTFNRNMALGGTKDSSNGQKGGGYGGALATTFEDNQIDDSSFENNFAQNGGGAIYLTGLIESGNGNVEEESKRGGKLTVNNSNFKENFSWGQGGAILAGTNSQELNINGSTFDGNEATYGGGAIWSGSKTNISGSTFKNNQVTKNVWSNFDQDVQAGKAEGGGAIFVGSSSNVTIEGSTFESNSSGTVGGAIATRGNSDGKKSSLSISESSFSKNHAKVAGGAISIGSDKEGTDEKHLVEITNTDFSENTSANGGALYNRGKVTITGGSFTSNTSEGVGGAITNSGGDLTLTNVSFTGNHAKTTGGAIHTNKSTSSNGTHKLTINSGSFVNNEAGYTDERTRGASAHNGGAIFAGAGTQLEITSTVFEGNKASGNGGAIAADNTSTFTDVTFKNNSAAVDGGALFIAGNSNNVTFKNNVTFEGNTAKDGKKNDINFGKDGGTITVDKNATLSLDGGISCNGGSSCSTAKVEMDAGSTLNVHNDTKIATKVEGKSNGSTDFDINVKLNAGETSFKLSDIFTHSGDATSLKSKLNTENGLYRYVEGQDGEYTSQEKSATEVASNLGVNGGEAETVLGIMRAKSNNASFQKVQQTLGDMAQDTKASANSKIISRAADALGADTAPVVQTRETALSNAIFDAASDALDDNESAMVAVGQSSGDSLLEKAKVWVKGLFNYADKDDTDKAHGFDIDTYGVAMGIDKVVGDGKVGLGYAYSQSDINGYTRDTDVDTHTAFVYGQYQPADWYVKGVAAYSWSDYKEKKSVLGENANAKYDVNTLALQGLYGYNFHVKNGYDITPEIGLRYLHISQGATTNALGVRVKDRDLNVWTAVAGLKAAKTFALSNGMNIRPEVRAAVTYDLRTNNNDSVVVMGNTSYHVNGEKLERLGYELGAKVATDVTSQWEIAAGYEGRFRDDYNDHSGILSAKYKF